jgi:hypothetical protein
MRRIAGFLAGGCGLWNRAQNELLNKRICKVWGMVCVFGSGCFVALSGAFWGVGWFGNCGELQVLGGGMSAGNWRFSGGVCVLFQPCVMGEYLSVNGVGNVSFGWRSFVSCGSFALKI